MSQSYLSRPCDDIMFLIGKAVVSKREDDTRNYWVNLERPPFNHEIGWGDASFLLAAGCPLPEPTDWWWKGGHRDGGLLLTTFGRGVWGERHDWNRERSDLRVFKLP